MKVALVGMICPFEGEADEIWCVNRAFINQEHATRVFFFDNVEAFEPQFIAELNESGLPVTARRHWDQVPLSKPYPLEPVVKYFGVRYFTCSVAYMTALAVMQGFTEITLAGMYWAHDSTEYFLHKPCMEFWIGQALGRGITVSFEEPDRAHDLDGNEMEIDGRTMLVRSWPWTSNQYGYRRNRNEFLSIQTMSCAYRACLGYPVSFGDGDEVDRTPQEQQQTRQIRKVISAGVEEAPRPVSAAVDPQ